MREVATLALYALGGAGTRQDSEDIAIKCHELSPARFGWTKHRHLPDKDAAGQALTDARRTRADGVRDLDNGLITGSPDDGWVLTPAGVTWCAEHVGLLDGNLVAEAARLTKREARTLAEIKQHPCFEEWRAGASTPSLPHVAGALLLTPSAPLKSVANRIDQMLGTARVAGDTDVEEYLSWLKSGIAQAS